MDLSESTNDLTDDFPNIYFVSVGAAATTDYRRQPTTLITRWMSMSKRAVQSTESSCLNYDSHSSGVSSTVCFVSCYAIA